MQQQDGGVGATGVVDEELPAPGHMTVRPGGSVTGGSGKRSAAFIP